MKIVDELLCRLCRPPRVLILDESDSVEAVLNQNYDCVVDKVTTGDEAVNMLLSNKYDLIYLNLDMLNGTGASVLKQTSEIFPNIPIVATTKFSTDASNLLRSAPLLTLLYDQITCELVLRLFKTFKINVRTKETAQYCEILERNCIQTSTLAHAAW